LRPSGYLVTPFLARNRRADDVIRTHLRMFTTWAVILSEAKELCNMLTAERMDPSLRSG
jgi:hypothetical protein